MNFLPQACSKFKIHALCGSYCDRKYIDNYSNTASGIPECLGLFVSCLSDRLVDIVSDLPKHNHGKSITIRDLIMLSVPFSGILINP